MPTQTPRLGLNKYSQNEEGWDHSDTVDALDQYAVVVDQETNRPASGEYDNQLFYAYDTKNVFRWVDGVGSW